jgi:probable HAF family extracellular repeat protein
VLYETETQNMLPTKRFSAVTTALLVSAALVALAMHSTAKGAKPGGGGTTATYTLTDLKGFSSYSTAIDLNNPTARTVQILGGSGGKNVLWEVTAAGTTLKDLSRSGLSWNTVAMNDAGMILGEHWSTAFVLLPESDVWHELPGDQWAEALNNLGDVACLESVWHVDAVGTVTLLSEFGGYEVFYARDINDLRVMAGSQEDIPAIAWFDPIPNADGTLKVQAQKLGLLPGTTFGRAYAINLWGDVVGECGEPIGDGSSYYPHAFLWTAAAGMIALGDFGGHSGRALDINDMGQVVGWASSASGGDSRRAFLWEKGKMSDLNVLAGAGGKRTLDDASAINNWGQIVGSFKVSGPGNERHAYLLTPKP